MDLELLDVASCPNVDLARRRIVAATERTGIAVAAAAGFVVRRRAGKGAADADRC